MLKLPNFYQKLESTPDDPPRSEIYGVRGETFQSIVRMFPLPKEYAMPLNTSEIIKGIHANLGDNQGIIEIEKGKTKNGYDFVYSIIKTKLEPSGLEYFLRMHIFSKEVIELDIFSDEIGTTGMRENMVFAMLKLKNFDDWSCDPYDKEYKKGLLMNKSEDRKYDDMTRGHPLTELRKTLEFICNNN